MSSFPSKGPVLLDTHVFVWLMQGVDRISDEIKRVIDKAAEANRLHIAAITPWEISLLVAKSRLSFPVDVGEWLEASIKRSQIVLVPLSAEISVASNRLPGEFHSDPADRMIVASARHLNALLITEDQAILNYAARDHVRAVAASAA